MGDDRFIFVHYFDEANILPTIETIRENTVTKVYTNKLGNRVKKTHLINLQLPNFD